MCDGLSSLGDKTSTCPLTHYTSPMVKVVASDGKTGKLHDISYTDCKVISNSSFRVILKPSMYWYGMLILMLDLRVADENGVVGQIMVSVLWEQVVSLYVQPMHAQMASSLP